MKSALWRTRSKIRCSCGLRKVLSRGRTVSGEPSMDSPHQQGHGPVSQQSSHELGLQVYETQQQERKRFFAFTLGCHQKTDLDNLRPDPGPQLKNKRKLPYTQSDCWGSILSIQTGSSCPGSHPPTAFPISFHASLFNGQCQAL